MADRRAILNAIITLLEPHLDNESKRDTQFKLLMFGEPRKPDVDLSGPPHQAVSNLIMALDQFGKLANGKYSLVALLEQLRNRFGANQQPYIDALIQQVNQMGPAPRSRIVTPSVPKPPVRIPIPRLDVSHGWMPFVLSAFGYSLRALIEGPFAARLGVVASWGLGLMMMSGTFTPSRATDDATVILGAFVLAFGSLILVPLFVFIQWGLTRR